MITFAASVKSARERPAYPGMPENSSMAPQLTREILRRRAIAPNPAAAPRNPCRRAIGSAGRPSLPAELFGMLVARMAAPAMRPLSLTTVTLNAQASKEVRAARPAEAICRPSRFRYPGFLSNFVSAGTTLDQAADGHH